MLINSYRFGATDPYFANVSLLLHGNGINGSTTILDSSPSPNTITAFGDARINTTIADPFNRTGDGIIAFDGNGDYLQMPVNAQLLLNADFTVEFFNKCNLQAANYPSAIGSMATAFASEAASFHIDHSLYPGKLSLYANGNETPILVSASNICDNLWHHIAIAKSGTIWRLFVDGNLEATNTIRTDVISLQKNGTRIGWDGWNGINGFYNGYLDELRITKGIARYTVNFAPPTAAFPDS